jgi:hypothetical protein
MIMWLYIVGILFLKLVWAFVFEPLKYNRFAFTIDRFLMSALFGLIIIVFHYGPVRKINFGRFIIDRIGLSFYLVHPPVIFANMMFRKQPLEFDFVTLVRALFN